MDMEKIRALAGIVSANRLSRLEVSEGELRIVMECAAAPAAESVVPGLSVSDTAVPSEEESPAYDGFVQTSPVVGTVYLSAEPGGAPIVRTGDYVKKGQRLCIVEAMKLFTDLTAERSGVIGAVLVQDGQTVGIGDALFEIAGQ